MNNYSIVKIGSEYVVLADEQRVLKVGSRRRAAQLVVSAAELLALQSEREHGTHQSNVIPGSFPIRRGHT
jgi:hypothetical protein